MWILAFHEILNVLPFPYSILAKNVVIVSKFKHFSKISWNWSNKNKINRYEVKSNELQIKSFSCWYWKTEYVVLWFARCNKIKTKYSFLSLPSNDVWHYSFTIDIYDLSIFFHISRHISHSEPEKCGFLLQKISFSFLNIQIILIL